MVCCEFDDSRDFWNGLFEHGIEGPADDETANFAGACSNLIELCVSQEPASGVVVDVPVPT